MVRNQSTIDKSKSSYEKKLERQRQMEKFEQIAAQDVPDDAGTVAGFFPKSNPPGRKLPDNTQQVPPQGAIENARRFLWDEDDDDFEMPSSSSGRSKPSNYGGSMNDSASSRASMFFAKTGIEQDQSRLKDIRGFESPGIDRAGSLHDVNLNGSFRRKFTSFRHRKGKGGGGSGGPMGACCTVCFDCTCDRRTKIVTVAALVFVALGAAAIAVAATVGVSSGGGSSNGNFGGNSPEKQEFPLGQERFDSIKDYILSTGMTEESDIDDMESAQNKAIWWLATSDGAQMEVGGAALRERYALVTFFLSTEPDWEVNTNWMTEVSVCKWHGVKCSEHHAVQKSAMTEGVPSSAVEQLNLPSNNIKGALSPELALLEELKVLNLGGNKIEDEIPPCFGKMKKLTVCELKNNELSGPIPTELGHLPHLKKLDLSNNNLAGPIPPTVTGWKKMTDFRISHNRISGEIPFQIGHATNLEILHLEMNEMEGEIPHAIGKLEKLRVFRFHDNKFVGQVPEAMCHLKTKERPEFLATDCSRNGDMVPCSCCQDCSPNQKMLRV